MSDWHRIRNRWCIVSLSFTLARIYHIYVVTWDAEGMLYKSKSKLVISYTVSDHIDIIQMSVLDGKHILPCRYRNAIENKMQKMEVMHNYIVPSTNVTTQSCTHMCLKLYTHHICLYSFEPTPGQTGIWHGRFLLQYELGYWSDRMQCRHISSRGCHSRVSPSRQHTLSAQDKRQQYLLVLPQTQPSSAGSAR